MGKPFMVCLSLVPNDLFVHDLTCGSGFILQMGAILWFIDYED